MFSNLSYSPTCHVNPSMYNNTHQHFEIQHGEISKNGHSPEPLRDTTPTRTPAPAAPAVYQDIDQYLYPTPLYPEWGYNTNQRILLESYPSYHSINNVGQAVPVNRANDQSGYRACTESIDLVPMVNEAQIRIPAPAPIGFGMVHPNFRQTDRRLRALDKRYINAAKEIIKVMSTANASRHFGTILTHDASVHQAKLSAYIGTLDLDIQSWISNCQSAPGLHRPEKSKDKKKNDEYDRLFCCLWCNSTFTVKHNLANHVRSHMDLHISFCKHCDFSSVCATLPTRHRCTA